DELRAIACELWHTGPKFRHVAKLEFLFLFRHRTQFGNRLPAALNLDDRAIRRLADEFGRADVQIANRCLPHVLHCSTWAGTDWVVIARFDAIAVKMS